MNNFEMFLQRKKDQYGKDFNPDMLANKFIPYYCNGKRIKVKLDGSGEELTGTIGVTTGWRPVFLLMRKSTSISSPWTLSEKDEIVAVKQGNKYIKNFRV